MIDQVANTFGHVRRPSVISNPVELFKETLCQYFVLSTTFIYQILLITAA